jgi:hypothetical protein
MDPKRAVLVGLLLCLPLVILLWLAVLGIEPAFMVGKDQPSIAGSLVVLGAALLLPVALVVSLLPVVRNLRQGGRFTAYPENLVLAGIILVVLLIIVGAIVVDQYPCWIGEPNCD